MTDVTDGTAHGRVNAAWDGLRRGAEQLMAQRETRFEDNLRALCDGVKAATGRHGIRALVVTAELAGVIGTGGYATPYGSVRIEVESDDPAIGEATKRRRDIVRPSPAAAAPNLEVRASVASLIAGLHMANERTAALEALEERVLMLERMRDSDAADESARKERG